MPLKETRGDVIECLKRRQKVEREAVSSTAQIMVETENPMIRLVMEIIQNDSKMHHLVQNLIVDSHGHKTVSLSPEELGKVWEMIKDHVLLERGMIGSSMRSFS